MTVHGHRYRTAWATQTVKGVAGPDRPRHRHSCQSTRRIYTIEDVRLSSGLPQNTVTKPLAGKWVIVTEAVSRGRHATPSLRPMGLIAGSYNGGSVNSPSPVTVASETTLRHVPSEREILPGFCSHSPCVSHSSEQSTSECVQ